MRYRMLIANLLFSIYVMILILTGPIVSYAAFTDASLNGDYWLAHFEYNTYPYHRCELGTVTFDGSGNYTFDGIESKEGEGADLPVADAGTYSVTPDGQISFDGANIGRLSDSGEVVIASGVSSTTSWEILMMVKKADTGGLMLIRQKPDLLTYKLQLYEVPTAVGGNTGPPIASDNNIGKNVLDIAGGDWDGYAGDELVVMRGTPGKARKLFIYSMPEEVGGNTGPPIASDRWFGKYRHYMTVGNFDGDPEPEVIVVQYVSAKDIYRLFTYDMPTTVDGDTGPAIASDRNIGGNVIGIAAANFDADPEDELVVVRLRADGKHRLQIYDVPATVGGNTGSPIVSDNNIGRYIITCGVAAGNFDDDPEPEVAVVRLLASDNHKLVIYDAPTSVGGDTGPPIATDNNIGKNIAAIAAW